MHAGQQYTTRESLMNDQEDNLAESTEIGKTSFTKIVSISRRCSPDTSLQGQKWRPSSSTYVFDRLRSWATVENEPYGAHGRNAKIESFEPTDQENYAREHFLQRFDGKEKWISVHRSVTMMVMSYHSHRH
ncbi:hypothetical protein Fot_11355 [Forsythia ovata]|uniref:Uncharacterized protein n=1 Tax=Forsythia ovata TaxID=205694 RepID=A0ABD1WJG1_9LAMI